MSNELVTKPSDVKVGDLIHVLPHHKSGFTVEAYIVVDYIEDNGSSLLFYPQAGKGILGRNERLLSFEVDKEHGPEITKMDKLSFFGEAKGMKEYSHLPDLVSDGCTKIVVLSHSTGEWVKLEGLASYTDSPLLAKLAANEYISVWGL